MLPFLCSEIEQSTGLWTLDSGPWTLDSTVYLTVSASVDSTPVKKFVSQLVK